MCHVVKWSKWIWAACLRQCLQTLSKSFRISHLSREIMGKAGIADTKEHLAILSGTEEPQIWPGAKQHFCCSHFDRGCARKSSEPFVTWSKLKRLINPLLKLALLQASRHTDTDLQKGKQNEQIEIRFRREFWSTTCLNADWPWVESRNRMFGQVCQEWSYQVIPHECDSSFRLISKDCYSGYFNWHELWSHHQLPGQRVFGNCSRPSTVFKSRAFAFSHFSGQIWPTESG